MRNRKISIIVTSFHKKAIDIMLQEALKTCREKNLRTEEIWVPGALEIPLALDREFAKQTIDGAVVLGIIERGETKHGMVMGISVTSAIIQLQIQYKKPVGVGILGPEILENQIEPRLKPYARDAVIALNVMIR